MVWSKNGYFPTVIDWETLSACLLKYLFFYHVCNYNNINICKNIPWANIVLCLVNVFSVNKKSAPISDCLAA